MDNNDMLIESLIADSRVAFMQGRYDQALRIAKQALSLDSKNADAFQCIGNVYMSKEDYSSAINSYNKAIENDSNNGDRYFNLGYAYASNNQPVDALNTFAKADEIGCSPAVTGQLYKIMAMICFDMQRYEDAILNFVKAEQIIGIDMDILQRKALSYSISGDTIAGIEVANQMKLFAPTDYLGYRIAFNILLQEERLDEAEKELDRAERFAKKSKDVFWDWVSYRITRYELEHDKKHLNEAIKKINDGLMILDPDVENVIEGYLWAADVYIRLENADMAIKCLNAAENPIQAYNYGFSVIEYEEKPILSEGRPSSQEVNNAVAEARRKFDNRRLEAIGRQFNARTSSTISDSDKYITPTAEKPSEEEEQPKLDSSIKAHYTFEMLDRIYQLYVSAYTIKNDIPNIKAYAAKLANSTSAQYKYMGKYSLVKALKQEGYEKADEEYQGLLKFFRNEMIKDPSNMAALKYRVQCLADLGEYDEAENLCKMLSDEIAAPFREQIEMARSGGDS